MTRVVAVPTCAICGSESSTPFPSPFPDPLWTCDGCGARYVFPAPSSQELQARYEAEHASGKWQVLFDQSPPEDTRRRAETFTRVAGAPGRLLDVGFGDGRFLDEAKAIGWSTWGLELSPSAASGAGPGELRRTLQGLCGVGVDQGGVQYDLVAHASHGTLSGQQSLGRGNGTCLQ